MATRRRAPALRRLLDAPAATLALLRGQYDGYLDVGGVLANEIARLGRYPLLVVDEVGYIPFDAAAANLIFQLVSARHERASMNRHEQNKPLSGWGEIFGDEVVAAAMIDRLAHHAEILAPKGDSYRSRDKDVAARPAPAQLGEG